MIRMEDISPDFAELLYRAGWNPRRRFEIQGWLETLRLEGFVMNAGACSILQSLGGLTVFLPPAGINPYDHTLSFDPLSAASGEVDRAEDWKLEIKVDLFPIGQVDPGGAVIWAGSEGRFYLGREFGLYQLGDSFRAAMDQLAFPNAMPPLCAEG